MLEPPPGEPKVPRVHTLSQALVVTGIVIAVANMALAWIMMFTRPTETAILAQPAPAAAAKPQESTPSNDFMSEMLRPAIRSGAMREVADTNVRTLTVSFAFALMAIGFSLFVMGIEGALSFRGEVPDIGRLVLTTASPGILCILLSAGMLALLLVLTQVTFGDTQEAARAEVIRAEAEAKVRLMEAETDARQRQNFNLEAEQARLEADEWRRKFEAQLEVQNAQGRPAPPPGVRK